LGRYPLYISRYTRIISYWCKILQSDNIIISSLYFRSLEDCKLGHSNWVSCVKKLLDDFGFSGVFLNPENVCSSFPFVFKERVISNFIQEWQGLLLRSPVLTDYAHYKTNFAYENYLDILPVNLRKFVTRFRICAHSLRIQTGRYGSSNIPRNERYCLYCGSRDLEDVYHFICICPCYITIRRRFLDRRLYVRPSVYKFNSLMGSVNASVLKNVANYIKYALDIRQSVTV